MKTTALVTGASGGIGLDLAECHAEKGGNLVLVARTQSKLEEVKAFFEKKYGVDVLIIAKDLSLPNAAQEVFDETQKNNIQIDYLINNAGIGDFGKFHENEWIKQKAIIDLNVTASTHLCHLYLQEMVKRKDGKILNVASVAAFQPGPLMSMYFASKAFLLHFSEAIDNEVRDLGITVSTLCPGPTQSDFYDKANLGDTRFSKSKALVGSKPVAQFGYKAMLKGEAVAIYGTKNYIGANASRFLTRAKMVEIIGNMQRKIR